MPVINLSKRMQAVADLVDGNCVADIGCDHAFVSIYLIQSGKADRVIAMDVKTGPVGIAEENVSAYELGTRIDVRLSDGFAELDECEADCAIIAGMGGRLMVDILRAGSKHTDNGIHLVLQPQSESDKVRRYLLSIGYVIIEEDMLSEEDKYYTVIKAVPGQGCDDEYNRAEYMYGSCLLNSKNSVLKSYLLESRTKNLELMEKLEHIHTESSAVRLNSLREENAVIQEALQYYD